jgi:predicted phosphodiesterase
MQLLATTISNAIKSEGNIDFVICTGDEGVGNYLYGERVDNITPFKTTVIENISPKTLFLPVVGNHDPYTEEEWYNCFGFPRQYSVELSSCFVIVLDVYNGSIEWSYRPSDPNADSKGFVTGHYMEENHLTGQRNLRFKAVDNVFLENNLKKAKAIGKDVFVALHTTDYGSATDEDYNAAQASVRNFYSLLDEYGCQLILEGHSHVIYNQKRGEQWRCNPGWFGPINDYNYDTSPWAINVFKQDAGYFKVYNNIVAHNYVDTPRLGNVPASSTPTDLWVDNIGRAEYKYI